MRSSILEQIQIGRSQKLNRKVDEENIKQSASIKNLETQIAHLARTVKYLRKGKLPSDTEPSPTKSCHVIHLRSGKELRDEPLMQEKKEREEKKEKELVA